MKKGRSLHRRKKILPGYYLQNLLFHSFVEDEDDQFSKRFRFWTVVDIQLCNIVANNKFKMKEYKCKKIQY